MIKCLHDSQISSLTGVHIAVGTKTSFYHKLSVYFNCGECKVLTKVVLLISANGEKLGELIKTLYRSSSEPRKNVKEMMADCLKQMSNTDLSIPC